MEISSVSTSAVKEDSQIPFLPISTGKKRMEPAWNKSVRIKEMNADILPLFKAVKKEEVMMLKPAGANISEKSVNARMVNARSSVSYPTKMADIYGEANLAVSVSTIPEMIIFAKRFCTSFLFSAP